MYGITKMRNLSANKTQSETLGARDDEYKTLGHWHVRTVFVMLMLLLYSSFAFSADINLGYSGLVEVSSTLPPYETNDSIHAKDYHILPGGNVVFWAGTEIVLHPGFEAHEGSEFFAGLLTYSISGTVTVDGVPAGGITLYISGYTSSGQYYSDYITVNSQGQFVVNAPSGTYVISELEEGYTMPYGSVTVVVDGQDVTLSDSLEIVEVNTKIVYYHHDMIGNTVAQTDDNGSVIMSASYIPYGDMYESSSEEGYEETHLFTGKEYDATGLYYFGARYYDPSIGRFLSIDPADGTIGNPQSWNRYAYCLNNPYKYVDPDGMWGEDVHYYDTMRWAKPFFSERKAHIIARACNNVDKIRNGKSYVPVVGNQGYHFNTRIGLSGSSEDSRVKLSNYHLENAIKLRLESDRVRKLGDGLWAKRLEVNALIELGTGLHALQDVDAHTDNLVFWDKGGGFEFLAHDGYKGKKNIADNKDLRPENHMRTSDKTRQYFLRYLRAIR